MKAQVLAVTTGLPLWGSRSPRIVPAQALALPFSLEIPYGRLIAFAMLSLADLILTWLLLKNSGGLVYESNPIANAFLMNYGWAGMVVFKVTDVLVVSWIALVICLFQPRMGRRVLSAACGIVAAVIVYSSVLAIQYA